jgi:membrane-associated phospholipid phosphatase
MIPKKKIFVNYFLKIASLLFFWFIWFTIYSLLNARGARVGIHWQAPDIYLSFMVYPYVFGMAFLLIIPWFFHWKISDYFYLLKLYTITSSIIFLVYYFYPIYMVRHSYDGLSGADGLMRWIVGMDDPANCFPSNHCALATIGFLGVYRSHSTLIFKLIILILTAIVCLSTVLVGQHYWLDIPTGIAVPLIVYFVMNKYLKRK